MTLILQVMEILSSPVWNTSNNAPPLAVPICGFRAELCPNKAISASSTLGSISEFLFFNYIFI